MGWMPGSSSYTSTLTGKNSQWLLVARDLGPEHMLREAA